MYLRDKTALIAGITMIALIVGTFVVVGFSIGAGMDNSPFEDDEAAAYLADVNDNEGALIVATAASLAVDGFLAPALAVLLYILFRDRSNLLATFVLAGILLQSAAALVADGSNALLIGVADDFVNGGANGISAGDPALFETGRILAMTSFLFFNIAFTPLGLALISLGLIVARAPEGAINPPRWLGWFALVAGVASLLAWGVVASEALFVFFPIQLVASAVFLLGTGGWLIANRQLQPAA